MVAQAVQEVDIIKTKRSKYPRENRNNSANNNTSLEVISIDLLDCNQVDFTVPQIHWLKVNENEKLDECLDLLRKKRFRNMTVTVITIIHRAHRTIPKKPGYRVGEVEIRIRTFRTQHF